MASPGDRDFMALYASRSSSQPCTEFSALDAFCQPHTVNKCTPVLNQMASSDDRDFVALYTSRSSPKPTAEFSALDAFCQPHTVKKCMTALNQELNNIGLGSLCDADDDDDDTVDTVRLVNCCYEILQKYQRSVLLCQDLETRLQRTTVEAERLRQSQSRLNASLEAEQKLVAQTLETERQVRNKNKLLNTKLKTEKDEVRRLECVVKHRDTQYKHELKKKEREQTRLKERLHQLLTDKTDRRIGIEIANNLQRTGRRGKWATNNKQEEEMYRGVISTYEENQKQLMVENAGLRDALTGIQRELVTMLNADDSKQEESESSDDGESTELSDGVFQMPYDIVRETIEENLRAKCSRVRRYIKKIEKQKKKQSRSSCDEVSRNVERYRQAINEQQLMLQSESLEDVTSSALDEAALWREKEDLERQKRLFHIQRTNFEQERQNFTDAAVRLSKEKKVFDEEKTHLLSQQFNNLTPFQKCTGRSAQRRSKSVGLRGGASDQGLTPCVAGGRLLPSTPCAPTAAHTPSTADLYRHLGLTTNGGTVDGTMEGVRLSLFQAH